MNLRNIALVASCFFVGSFICAKDKGTGVARFMVEPSDLKDQVKTFVNNTGNTISVRYGIQDYDSGKFYKQEPILKDGESLTIDFSKAASYGKAWKTLSKKHEFSLEILRVLSLPKRLTENVTQGLKKGRMKSGKRALLIGKSEFLKGDTIEFFKDKKGCVNSKLSYRSIN